MASTRGVAISLLLLIASCSIAAGQVCGNGVVEITEECDDSNNVAGDGCGNCTVESLYQCSHNSTSSSLCGQVLLDLSSGDHTSLGRSLEFSDLSTPVFLVDPDSLAFIVRTTNWTYVDILILQGEGVSIPEEVGLQYDISPPPRPYQQDRYPSDYPTGVNGRPVDSGLRVLIDRSIQDLFLAESQLDTVLLATMYRAHEIPTDYLPRHVCLVASDPTLTTEACVTLHYIGYNVNPPTLDYEMGSVAVFVEGQSEPLLVVAGNITVTDDDHPTRYLMESASASIVGFMADSEEWLSLYSGSNLNHSLTHSFDSSTGTLTISGNATTQVYSHVLQQLTYFNNMSQPHELRTIEVTVFDGIDTSDAIYIQIDVMNTNDNPSVSLDGETPVITTLTSSYTEGSGAVAVAGNLHVIDIDPSALISRATVVLTNPVDGGQEALNLTATLGLSLSLGSPPHSLELSGAASPADYTTSLRSLTYHHLSANPGNPSPQSRLIQFTVEDTHNATSGASNLTLVIVPVNDAPLLSFLTGGSQELYSYNEDDPAISIGLNLTLMDIDSPIESVSLLITNLLDGAQDIVAYDSALLTASAITATTTSNGTSSEIVFSGASSDTNYTEILRSLTYSNLHTSNSITDGQRTISISATDTGGQQTADSLTLLVDVAERNDGPAINLGAGNDQGFTITYTEGGSSVGIGLSHLISIMDEEGHAISSMDIELVATNGPLDDGDILFPRTPEILRFLDHPNTTITETRISVALLGNNSHYVDVLQVVRYVNTEPEPTLFVDGVRLRREIVITITDSATVPAPTTNVVRVTVEIEPINDNAPRIIINSDPMCTQDSRDSEMMSTVSRRSVASSMPFQRRRRRTSTFIKDTNSFTAPQVLTVQPVFLETSNGTCLLQLGLQFNTNTSAPVVEVQQELGSLLTFAPASLAKTPHHGYWTDYRTLVIVFRECVKWEGEQGNSKPLYVVFYGSEGSCTWDSPCDKGVCYYNRTGCPIVGYHRVNTSTNEGSSPEPDSLQKECTTHYGPDRLSVFVLSAVLLVAVVTVAGCQCRKVVQGGCDTKGGQRKEQGKHSHVIDIHIPTITAKSPPLPSTTERAAIVECQKMAILTEEHCSPPYVESCTTTLISTVNAMVKPETTSGVGPTEMGKIEDNDGSAAVDEVADEGKSVASDFLRRNRRQRLPTTHGRGVVSQSQGTGGGGGAKGIQGNSIPPREHSSRQTHSDQQSNTVAHTIPTS